MKKESNQMPPSVIQFRATRKEALRRYISLKNCPKQPPVAKYKTIPLVGTFETRKSIQARRDYKNYIEGFVDGYNVCNDRKDKNNI